MTRRYPVMVTKLKIWDKAVSNTEFKTIIIRSIFLCLRILGTGKSVAMALIETSSAKIGTRLDVRIHRKLHKATVVKKKFYDKKYKK